MVEPGREPERPTTRLSNLKSFGGRPVTAVVRHHMSYFAYDRMGNAIASPDEVAMRNLLGSLAVQGPEHPDVSLNHESGWSASVFGNGLVVLENVETGEGPWHMSGKSPEEAISLWRLLAAGKFEELKSQPWATGYGDE